MPVILAPEAYDSWMDPDLTDPERLKAFLKPYPSERMTVYPVSTAVNNPMNDQPRLHRAGREGLSTRAGLDRLRGAEDLFCGRLSVCGLTRLDGDNDGVPCEALC